MGIFDSFVDYISNCLSTVLFDDSDLGEYGESLTEVELKKMSLWGIEGKILRNLYVPKDNGETTEIDVLFICSKGILVIESKNYSGWIFGNEDDTHWTATLPNGDRNRFYNPIKQNQTHIKWLLNYMGKQPQELPVYSIIAFSERCTLKSITLHSHNLYVVNRDMLRKVIGDIWKHDDAISEAEIVTIFDALAPLTKVDEETKQKHVNHVRANNQETDCYKGQAPNTSQSLENMILRQLGFPVGINKSVTRSAANAMTCPKCGEPLVLRTAGKGANAGNQFYGCSRFPKCRYTRNI